MFTSIVMSVSGKGKPRPGPMDGSRVCRTQARKGHWYPTFICCTVYSVQLSGEAEQVKRISRVRQRLVRKMLSYLPAPMAALNLSRGNSSLSK
jgi:hypothetical protein